jgi:threonine/homoserine/homoserine lactone efflux protein
LPLDTLTLFFAASLALGIAPGPDNLFVLTQSGLYGRKAGLAVTAGLCTGLLVHTSAVAVGVAVIFQTSEFAFNALKIIGAAYLLYLAWLAFENGGGRASDPTAPPIPLKGLYLRGIVMNVTNPKVAIFFLAFLPQFADPATGPIAIQILILGSVFIAATIIVFGAIAVGAGMIGRWLRRTPGAQGIMNRVTGFVFVGLAVRLALTER